MKLRKALFLAWILFGSTLGGALAQMGVPYGGSVAYGAFAGVLQLTQATIARAIVWVGASGPSNAWIWQSDPTQGVSPGSNPISGVCTDPLICVPNLFVAGRESVDASAATNGFYAYNFVDNYGGAGAKGAHHTASFNFSLVATPDNEGTSRFYSALNTSALATANANGTLGSPSGALFGFNPQCILGSGATFFLGCVGQETDLSIRSGASSADLVGYQVVLDSLHANAPSRYGSAYVLAAQNNTVPKLDRVLTDGEFSGFPALSPGGTWFSCFPNQGSGSCGSITNFADLSKYTSISGKIINGPGGTFYVDGSFNGVFNGMTAASYSVGATAGVSCTGTPTASYAVTNGIVTHC